MKSIKNILTWFSLTIALFTQPIMAASSEDTSTKHQNAVPAECAAFTGAWVGTWTYGNYGEMRLQVTEVNGNCIAKGTYGENEGKAPWPFEAAQIKGGVLSWLCNRNRGGTCFFEDHGDALRAKYTDPNGGSNAGVFKKVTR